MQKIPQHVGIVMDGNGRWAEMRGLSRSQGHRAGVEAIRSIVAACPEKKIPMLSVFAFGQENWARPNEEVRFLMQLFFESLEREVTELHEKGVCLKFIGAREQLDEPLQALIASVEALTAQNEVLQFNVMMNYSGRWDIVQATRRIVAEVQSGKLASDSIDEACFSSYLSTAHLPEPDILIRTSGEQRISNFFLWQLAYSELYFSGVTWPDFTLAEFEKALVWYSARERRYGKTSQQVVEENHA